MEFKGDPVAFSIFGIDVYWYGIIIITGMILAILISKYRAKKWGVNPEIIDDIVLVILPAAIIGARLYYVIFEWEHYRGDFLKIIDIRSGGLAIHGGIIGAVISGYIYCKKKDIDFFVLADIILPTVILAQGIGRWGNFVNQEAYGGPTDLPWALIIDGKKYHPTFLYESIGDILIFLFLHFYITKRQKHIGLNTGLYLILYGILRYFVEGLRTDSLYLGNIRVAQLVSIIGIFLGIFIIFYFRRKEKLIPPLEKEKIDMAVNENEEA